MFNIKTLNEIDPVYRSILTENEYRVGADVERPDAIIVRSADMHQLPVPASLLAVGRAGVGVNNIPLEELGKKGVCVFNSPGANANAVKELVVGSLFLASRHLCEAANWAQSLKGKGADVPKLVEKGKNQFVGPEIEGKTLGVIGLGAIGGPAANAAVALGMNVMGCDPYITVDNAWRLSRAIVQCKDQNELLAASDYVTVHIPLVDATRGSFHAGTFAKMKRGAVLMNFSRGELVVTSDVLAALASGQLGAYVTDFPSDELLGVPGVIAIPHLGASTPESEENCVRMIASQLDAYLKEGSIMNSVNFPNCELPACHAHRVAVMHANVPNMVSSITSVIAAQHINIDNMVNKSRGPFAYSVLDTDEPAVPAALAAIENIPGVYRVRVIH